MIYRLLNYIGMIQSNSTKTPPPSGLDFSVESGNSLSNETLYRQLAESLLHISSTVRLNIAYTVGYLSRFMQKPNAELWKSAKHRTNLPEKYRRARHYFYCRRRQHIACIFWSRLRTEKPSRKHISGGVVMCASRMINWRLKKQSIVAQSSKNLNLQLSCFVFVMDYGSQIPLHYFALVWITNYYWIPYISSSFLESDISFLYNLVRFTWSLSSVTGKRLHNSFICIKRIHVCSMLLHIIEQSSVPFPRIYSRSWFLN